MLGILGGMASYGGLQSIGPVSEAPAPPVTHMNRPFSLCSQYVTVIRVKRLVTLVGPTSLATP